MLEDTADRFVPVSHIMSGNYLVYPESTALLALAKIFSEKSPTAILLHRDKKIVGIVSEKTILKTAHITDLKDLTGTPETVQKLPAMEFMDKPISVYENESVSKALEKMVENNTNILIVTDIQNNIIGVVAQKDIPRRYGSNVKTSIDEMLNILETVDSIRLDQLAKQLQVNEKLVQDWGRVLEERHLIEVNYPAFGKPTYKKMKYKPKEE